MGVSSCCHCQHYSPEKGGTSGAHSRDEGVHGWLSFPFHHPSCQLASCHSRIIRLLGPASSQRQCTQDLSFSGELHFLVLPGPAAPSGLAILSLGSGSALTLGAERLSEPECSTVLLSIIDAPSFLHTRIMIYSGLQIPVLAAAHLQALPCTAFRFNIIWSPLPASTRVAPVARLRRLASSTTSFPIRFTQTVSAAPGFLSGPFPQKALANPSLVVRWLARGSLAMGGE